MNSELARLIAATAVWHLWCLTNGVLDTPAERRGVVVQIAIQGPAWTAAIALAAVATVGLDEQLRRDRARDSYGGRLIRV